MRLALILNPRSRKNRRNGKIFAQQARKILGDGLLMPTSHEELARSVEGLARRDVRLIAISGGDGTVSDVLTAIMRAYPEGLLPDIAILPSGNTNLVAQDIGFSYSGVAALRHLLQHGAILPRTTRRPLKISWPENEQEPRLGMFLGSAGYARGIAIAHSPHVLRYAPHNLAVAVALAGTFISLLLRKQREIWLRGNRVTLVRDGEVVADGRCFLFLTTALEKLNLGLWPFWETPQEQTKGREKDENHRLHFLHVVDHPKHLFRAAWGMLRGKAPAWARKSRDYLSGRASEVVLTCEGDFVVDGEHFCPGAGNRVIISAGPEIAFVHD